jgi:tRNA threonylcarbamoyladenosine biosynthesis protein TsaB
MMSMNVLVLETSTEAGSVAVASDGVLVATTPFSSRDPATGLRTEALGPAVIRCLADGCVSARDLSAVVCGAGPGGFTSLRSAAALAKGMCAALRIPLYAVSSLELLAWSARVPDGHFIVALHAGRNEWFGADADSHDGRASLVGAPYLIGDDELRARASGLDARLVGPGLELDVSPRADAVVPWLDEIVSRGAVDLDMWEPTYGRLAEAQVKWEAAHGRSLSV